MRLVGAAHQAEEQSEPRAVREAGGLVLERTVKRERQLAEASPPAARVGTTSGAAAWAVVSDSGPVRVQRDEVKRRTRHRRRIGNRQLEKAVVDGRLSTGGTIDDLGCPRHIDD